MITALDILNQKRLAKKKTMEGEFITKLMDDVIDALSIGKTTGSVYVGLENKEYFNLFIEVLQEVIKYNFAVDRVVTKFTTNPEDFEAEIYFDLEKESFEAL